MNVSDELKSICYYINGHDEEWNDINATLIERSDAFLSLEMKLIEDGYNHHRTGCYNFRNKYNGWCEVDIFYLGAFLLVVTRHFDDSKNEVWTANKLSYINVDCLVLNGKECTV